MTEQTETHNHMIQVSGTVAPYGDVEKETLTVTMGGEERFMLVQVYEGDEPGDTKIKLSVTGLNPETLPDLLRDLANGMEAKPGE